MDGRNQRVVWSKEAILLACREAMVSGIPQPRTDDIARAARVSVRTIFQHYGDLENLRLKALDEATEQAILLRIIGPDDFQLGLGVGRRIVLAAVLGRIIV